jgi:predicted nuclease with TOPRIM domain
MKQIDQWEDESTEKIRRTAREVRQKLIDHIANANRKLEAQLEILTNKLRKSRQENELFEPNLDEWRDKLVKMKDDLTEQSNIIIQNDPTPLVTKIIIDIPGKIFDDLCNRSSIHFLKKSNIHAVTSYNF